MINFKDLLLYISVALIGGTVVYGTFFKADVIVHEPDFSEVYRLDSLIKVKEKVIVKKSQEIAWRDSLLVSVVGLEQEKRDTILNALTDNFSESTGEERDSLISEALNSL